MLVDSNASEEEPHTVLRRRHSYAHDPGPTRLDDPKGSANVQERERNKEVEVARAEGNFAGGGGKL